MGEVDKPETYQDKIKGLDVVVSALGGRALESQIPLFHAAKHAGIKLVLPSEYGFDSTKVYSLLGNCIIFLEHQPEHLQTKWKF